MIDDWVPDAFGQTTERIAMFEHLLRLMAFGTFVATLVLGLPSGELGAQFPPPVICTATVTGVTPGQATGNYTAGPPAGWMYSWGWIIDFTCSSGNFTNCGVAGRVDIQTYDFVTGTYSAPHTASCASAGFNYSCNASHTAGFTSTYGPAVPGAKFNINFYGASWDTSYQSCEAQSYSLGAFLGYDVPPAP